jgi:CDP-diacylglycerol---serine O-phosphatidyltransferase
MKNRNKRLTFFLPNIFTALNMACGMGSILLVWKQNFYMASMILVLGGIFDMVDGRMARLTGTESQFGEQFDSLSDVVSFGMAPAILFYFRFLSETGRAGIIASFIYLLCGALRLARFNANIEKVGQSFFQGLPIPVGALGVVGITLISIQHPLILEYKISLGVFILFISFLMISNLPFCSFKNSEFVRRHKKGVLLIIFIILAMAALYEEYMVGVITGFYIISSLLYFLIYRRNFIEVVTWTSEEEDEGTPET